MKSILSVLLAVMLLMSALAGCAKDMSGENRNSPTPAATSTPAATATAAPSATPEPTDSADDGMIDEGEDAVDGVVGAGGDAVDDMVDAAEDAVDDVTGNTDRPAATPKTTAKP